MTSLSFKLAVREDPENNMDIALRDIAMFLVENQYEAGNEGFKKVADQLYLLANRLRETYE